MIIETPDAVAEGTLASSQFSVKMNAQMFKLLYSQIYENKERIVLQELSANALDAHRAVNKLDVPIHIQLPSELNPELIVEDFGVGMSHEFLTTRFVCYGDSTKSDDNEHIGGFGLGSKTPLALVGAYTVESTHKGITSTISCFIKDGYPDFADFGFKDMGKTDGTRVIIPVCDAKVINELKKEVLDLFMLWDVKPNITSGHCQEIPDNVLAKKDTYYLISEPEFNSGHKVAVGPFVYNIPDKLIHRLCNNSDGMSAYVKICRNNMFNPVNKTKVSLLLKANIGELELAPSRDRIEDTDQNYTVLRKLADSLQDVCEELPVEKEIEYAAKVLKEFGTFYEKFQGVRKLASVSIEGKQALFDKICSGNAHGVLYGLYKYNFNDAQIDETTDANRVISAVSGLEDVAYKYTEKLHISYHIFKKWKDEGLLNFDISGGLPCLRVVFETHDEPRLSMLSESSGAMFFITRQSNYRWFSSSTSRYFGNLFQKGSIVYITSSNVTKRMVTRLAEHLNKQITTIILPAVTDNTKELIGKCYEVSSEMVSIIWDEDFTKLCEEIPKKERTTTAQKARQVTQADKIVLAQYFRYDNGVLTDKKAVTRGEIVAGEATFMDGNHIKLVLNNDSVSEDRPLNAVFRIEETQRHLNGVVEAYYIYPDKRTVKDVLNFVDSFKGNKQVHVITHEMSPRHDNFKVQHRLADEANIRYVQSEARYKIFKYNSDFHNTFLSSDIVREIYASQKPSKKLKDNINHIAEFVSCRSLSSALKKATDVFYATMPKRTKERLALFSRDVFHWFDGEELMNNLTSADKKHIIKALNLAEEAFYDTLCTN